MVIDALKLSEKDFRIFILEQLNKKVDVLVQTEEDEKWRKEVVHKLKKVFSE